jgi:type II secretory pathway predicted ATPase ExeA
MDVVAESNRPLSVVLVRKPKLRNDLRRRTMGEIGHRTTILKLQGVTGCQAEYIRWLLEACSQDGVDPAGLMTEDAIELGAARLRALLHVRGADPVLADGLRPLRRPASLLAA